MNDLDERITDVLRAHADGPVDTVALSARAVERGRTLQRRRRVGYAATSVGVVALAAMTAVVASRPSTQDSASHPRPSLPALPVAVGVPGLDKAPSQVGADAGTVHFSVDALTAGARTATWTVSPGLEQVQLIGGAVPSAHIAVARKQSTFTNMPLNVDGPNGAPASVGDRVMINGQVAVVRSGASTVPGTRYWQILWQPVRGVWARVDTHAPNLKAALGVANALQSGNARRCVIPYRLTSLPTGFTKTGCSVTLDRTGPGPHLFSDLTVSDGTGKSIELSVQRDDHKPTPHPNGTVDGHRFAWRADIEPTLEMHGFHGLVVFLTEQPHGFSEPSATKLIRGMHVVPDLEHPATW